MSRNFSTFSFTVVLMAALVIGLSVEAKADLPTTTATLSSTAADPVYGSFAVSARFNPPIFNLRASDISTTNATVSGLCSLTPQPTLSNYYDNLAVRPDGTVAAWSSVSGTPTYQTVPADLTDVISVSARISMALKRDGTVVMLGGSESPPPGLANVMAISAGLLHCLALKTDGTVVAWGWNRDGQCNVPAGLGRVTAVAAGEYHSLALRENGTVAAWGYNHDGQCNVPDGLTGVVAVAAGWGHSMALTSSGWVVVWGSNMHGQLQVPGAAHNVVAIAAGRDHCLALRADGGVAAWGWNSDGQATSPADLTDATEISAGYTSSLARRRDGSVYAWGRTPTGPSDAPPGLIVRAPAASEFRFDLTPLRAGLVSARVGAGVTSDTFGTPNIASNLLQRLYVPCGGLRMQLDPPRAVTAGAKWRRTGTTSWLNSNTTETGLIPGHYTVEFKNVTNWTTPASQDVAVTSSQVTQASASYTYQLSSLKVKLQPAGAVAAGAKWRRTGTTNWYDSDYEELDLQPGGCTVEFKPLVSWATPASQAITLTKGQMALTTGTYVQQLGSLCVTLAPPEAVAAGARWRRAGTTVWLASGATETAVPTGNTTLEFQSLPLWAVPTNASVTVNPDQTTAINCTYAPCLSQMSWSSLMGGSGLDSCNAIAVSRTGLVYYIVGTTSSPSGMALGGNGMVYGGGASDVFVARLTTNGYFIDWCTYLGGAGEDKGTGIVIDADGNLIVTGTTSAGGWASKGYNTQFRGETDAFVAKLAPSGALLWSTYLGGAQAEEGSGVAVDATGNIYATGTTASEGWVNGGFKTSIGSGPFIPSDAYVVKLSPSGQHLWSTYLGGADMDFGNAITVDSAGKVLVAGSMNAPGWFTTGNFKGAEDAFVAKLTPAGACLWSLCLGGGLVDRANAIATDRAGNVIVAGETNSPDWTAGGYDTTLDNPASQFPDAFVARLSPSGMLQWSTYLGGNDIDRATSVAADTDGTICVAGESRSAWAANGFDTTYGGASNSDGFVAKLTPAGAHVWSTYLGDSAHDAIKGLALESWTGDLFVTGETSSGGWVADGFDISYGGGARDAVMARLHDLRPTTPTASLTVGISPAAAADAGGQWRPVSTSEWLDGGLAAINLAGGSLSVEFKPIAGWTAPKSQTVTITAGQSQLTTGTYVRQTGTLQVTLTPAAAVTAGAQWRRVGTTTWLNSGASEANVPTGNLQVEFKDIINWKKPANLIVAINYNQTTSASQQYTYLKNAITTESWLSYQ